MKLRSLFLLLLAFPLSVFASPERRFGDLALGTEMLINLRDPELLDQRERKWQQGSAENGLRCSLSIKSHYDRAAAEKSGPTVYRLTQINPGDSYSVRNQEGRDQASLWLTTDNKDLPYFVFDCFRIYKAHKARRSPITLGAVVELVGMPNLFLRPIFGKEPSLTAEQFFPELTQSSRARLLQPLEFEGINAERDRVSIIEPRVQFGKIVEKFEKGSTCRVSYRHPRMENYKRIMPTGLELRVTAVTGLSQHDGTQLFSLYMETTDHLRDEFQITCYSGREFFKGFSEFEAHFHSIVELKP